MSKPKEEDYNQYCKKCGTCGYIGCCGVREFLEKHVKGKTDCLNEAGMVADIIAYCEDPEAEKARAVEEAKAEFWNNVTFYEMIDWWLKHYKGIEHLTEGGSTKPESWYTITTILERCFKKLRNGESKLQGEKRG